MGTGAKRFATALMYVAVAGVFAWTRLGLPRCRGDEPQTGNARSAGHVTRVGTQVTVKLSAKADPALNAVAVRRPGMAQARLTAPGRTQTVSGALKDAVQRPL